MTPATWLMGFAAGLLFVGLAGIIAAWRGHIPGWYDWYYLLPIWLFGSASGWLAGAAMEFQLWYIKEKAFIRGTDAHTGALIVETERRTLALHVPPDETTKDTDYDAEREAWRVALDRFFRAGETAGGFSAGKLSGVAGSDAWPRLVHFYASESGGNVLRDAGGNVGHTWGHGWTLDRVMLALSNNRLPLPQIPLPFIQPYIASAAPRRAPQKSKMMGIKQN